MIRTHRTSTSHPKAIMLLVMIGLMLLAAALLPASRTVVARVLSIGDGSAWLEMVDQPNQLYTEFPLAHLSGRLIHFGAVDASACENSGLNSDANATECGLKAAQPLANEWQNRYNKAILETSKQQNIPPRLLKNIFAWESQFWPETTYNTSYEFGLGHITLDGADSALRWDTALYDEICGASFNKETCNKDVYGYQPASLRSALQGVLSQKLNANCAGCQFSLDLNKAEQSIPYIGKVLQANALYVRYAVKVFSGKEAEDLVSNEDLWRFTLVSYNAGPGCYRSAMSSIYYRGFDLTWENLKNYLEPACKGAIPYINFVSKTSAYHPEDDPALHPTSTPPAQPTATSVSVAMDVPHVDNQVVVKINPAQLDSALKTLKDLNINADQVGAPIDPAGSRVIQVLPEKLKEILAGLRASPNIASAEPNYLVSMASLPVGYPDDPRYATQPNLTTLQVPAAWDALSIVANPGAPITVAVLDTGVNLTHEDLVGRFWTNTAETNCTDGIDNDHNGYIDDCFGWNMVNRNNNPQDDNNHGSEMAGVIAATTNNAMGIAGIAPNARIMPIKVLDATGIGTHVQMAEGIYYAANMGAQIIYIGGTGSGNSVLLTNAVAYAISKGIMIIAPSGNDNSNTVDNYPSSYPGVISVSAVNNGGTIAPFSTRSNTVSLVAPGVGIVSTGLLQTYPTASGTSLAAAHVVGVAAMLAGQPQFLNHMDMVRAALINSALDLGAAGRDSTYGYGLLRANNALSAPTPTASVSISSPTASAIFTQGQAITFTATALSGSTDISSSLAWTSNIDGPIGTGATFSTTRLTPGLQTITATVAGGSAFLNIRVLEISGPHGKFAIDAVVCTDCHETHSIQNPDVGSAYSSNNFCLSCHNGSRAKEVSTHSNMGSGSTGFEVLCMQCHEPHGNTFNIFAIRTNMYTGSLPTHFNPSGPQTALVVFNTLNAVQLNNLCISCHVNIDNPLTGHSKGQICTTCHYHDSDGNPATKDGFMPNGSVQLTMQAQYSPTPAATSAPTTTRTVTVTPLPTTVATDTPVPTPEYRIETPVP